MTEREDAISRIERVIQRTNNSSITVTIPKYTARLVVALLKEHEEQIKNRDESLEKAREEIKWLRGMLKEQEARILDWDELEDWGNAVWFEDNDEHECYIALIANVGTYHAKFTNVEPSNIHSLVFMRDFYMKDWRCWSARPTIKQRQAVKWDE